MAQISGALTATGTVVLTKPATDTLTVISVSGTYATLSFVIEGSDDGTNYFPVAATAYATQANPASTISPSDDTELAWKVPSEGLVRVRVNATGPATGTATFNLTSYALVGTAAVPVFSSTAVGAATGTSLAVTGAVTSSGTSGVGYAAGAGGAITQGSSRTTGVTLDKICGAITLVSAAGSATPFSFTVTNSTVAATDTVVLSQKSGTDLYTTLAVTNVGAGSFKITAANASGTTTEQPVFNFAVIKAKAS